MPPVSATLSIGQQSLADRAIAEPRSSDAPADVTSAPRAGRRQRVLEQHRDRQRADAAGHRRQRAGDLGDRRDARRRRRASRAARTRRAASSPAGTARSTIARSVDRGCADVDDRRARLDEVRRDERRPADRRHQDVAPRARPRGRSPVREWQIVTVACRCSSSSAIGLPTMSLRPMTTARAPAIAMPDRSSSSITPDGVHGDERRAVLHQPADVDGMKPSTSLSGSMASNTRRSASAPIAAGSGDCTRMPSCTSLRFSRSHDRAAARRATRSPAAA